MNRCRGVGAIQNRRAVIATMLLTLLVTARPVQSLDPEREIHHFREDFWQKDDGLPQNTVSAITQTADGYLWMGTYNGLVRFDGVRFAVLDASSRPVLQNGRVTALFESDDGVLWLGHENGDLSQLRSGTLETVVQGSDWSAATVTSLQKDGLGDLCDACANDPLNTNKGSGLCCV
jgi:ligand-binding sensor domain-containing protein